METLVLLLILLILWRQVLGLALLLVPLVCGGLGAAGGAWLSASILPDFPAMLALIGFVIGAWWGLQLVQEAASKVDGVPSPGDIRDAQHRRQARHGRRIDYV